ncbi:MAG: MotA/TolQ/ExbB proton channel family protein, partial [Candidatus Krumholzibacteria bacterium]|nr:MotA/TolQ/ExbB proton channel family protein [Candidatus Krumholzibacteria bacterium]
MDPVFLTPFAVIGKSIFTLVSESGPFAKFILLIIFVISVISWAIIIDRSRLFLRLRRGGQVLQTGLASKGLALPMETVKRCLPSLEGALLLEAKRFLEDKNNMGPGGGETLSADAAARLRGLLEGRPTTEIYTMEKNLIFLATTASISPFLGLLGTVWGIMSSFLSMGVEGTASIQVVGPGIAEAL